MKIHIVLLLFHDLLITKTFGETIKVLTTVDDVTKFSDGSGAKLKTPPNLELVDITVSLRFSIFLLVNEDIYLMNSKDDNYNFIFTIHYYSYQKWFGFHGKFVYVKNHWPTKTLHCKSELDHLLFMNTQTC